MWQLPNARFPEDPRKSARGCMWQPPSTRFPEGSCQSARERVLGEVNSTPERSVPRRPGKAPEGPADEVSISQRSEAAFNERAWPDIQLLPSQHQFLPCFGREAWGH